VDQGGLYAPRGGGCTLVLVGGKASVQCELGDVLWDAFGPFW
jgi:hypothetical protein